jgi:hypothetical protein
MEYLKRQDEEDPVDLPPLTHKPSDERYAVLEPIRAFDR